jgi:hypothetical protein
MKSAVRIVGQGIDHVLTVEADAVLAICREALELPEFLKQHPECARGDRGPDSDLTDWPTEL